MAVKRDSNSHKDAHTDPLNEGKSGCEWWVLPRSRACTRAHIQTNARACKVHMRSSDKANKYAKHKAHKALSLSHTHRAQNTHMQIGACVDSRIHLPRHARSHACIFTVCRCSTWHISDATYLATACACACAGHLGVAKRFGSKLPSTQTLSGLYKQSYGPIPVFLNSEST